MAVADRRTERFGIRELEVLLAVAETGSFRRAASRLDVNQSAVTRRVQRLEAALGVSVFERLQTGARLTPAGARFASDAHVIIADLQNAIETARSAGVAEAGRLRIGIIAMRDAT